MKLKKDKNNPPVRKKTRLQASLEKTKKAPQESTLRYKTLVETAPVGIVENDHSGVISYSNGVFADLVGYTAAEIIGKHTWELVTPKLRDAVRDDIVKILEDQSQPTSYVTKLSRKNGKAIDVQIDFNCKRNRRGDITGLISSIIDITGYKETDAAFIESEEQFRTAIEHFHDGVVLVKKHKLVYVNQKFLDIFGYDKPEEVIGKSPTIVIHPDDRPVVRQYRIQRERGEIFPEEYVHKGIKKDGTTIFIEASISETLYRGEPVAFIYQKDITDRKTTEEALRESENKFRDLAEKTLVGIYVVQDGFFRYVNDACAKIHGCEIEELVNKKNPREFVLPEDVPIVTRNLQARMLGQIRSLQNDFRIITKSGEIRYVETYGAHTTYLGKPATIGTIIDVTERKQAEEALKASEDRFRTLIEKSGEVISLTDANRKCIYVSPSIEAILGYSVEEYCAPGRLNIFHPDDIQMLEENRAWILKHPGEATNFICRRRHKNGSWRWMENTTRNLLDDPGVRAIVMNYHDITERKNAEEALKKSEEKYRNIFENAVEGIFQTTPEGKFISVNPALARMHGYESADELMRSIISTTTSQIYVDPQDRKKMMKLLEKQDVVKDFQTRMYKKDGSIIWVSMTSHVVRDGAGKVEYREGVVEDITERKEAEDQLLESEERYRTAIEHSNDGVALIRNRRYIYVNRKFLEIFGYEEPEDVIGKHPMITAHPDDLKRLKEYGKKRQQGGQAPERYEFKGLRKDGTIIFIEVSIAETMYQGRPVVLCYLRDITERRLTDVALKQSEERFRSLVEKSSEVIFLTNENQKRIYVSPPITRILGYTVEEFLSLGMGEFTHPDDAIAVNTARSHILANPGETVTFVNRLRHKDGSWRWVETTTRNLLNEPSVRSLVANFHDITESKLAEEELRESEAKYRNVIDNLIVGFYITQDNRFCFVNRALCEASGYSYDELVGKMNPLDLIHNDDKEFIAGIMAKRLAGEIDHEGYVYKVLKKDGQVMIVKGVSNLMIYNGRPAIAGGIMDITRETILESQLRQAQKMEAVGTLAGGIAHDFNNILTAIIGYGRLLQMKMAETDPLRTYVAHVLSSSETAANLTRNLLAFSRKQIVELKPVNVGSVVMGTEKLLKSLLTEDIELKILLPDSDITIMADTSQVEQVLLNLASNANDAMPRGGTLTIEIKEIELKNILIDGYDSVEPGIYALISMADTGAGIDEKIRDNIFEPFFTTKEVGKGTGLGLSIVRGIVDQHRGYITVNTKLQGGTVFQVYLPVVKTAVEETETILLAAEGGTETILVAEDDAQVRGLTTEILNSAGYTIIEAIDGEDAVKKFVEHGDTVELLLLDVVMPRKNGKEAYDEIRKINPDIRVIFMSGYTGDVIIGKGIIRNESDFIQKPLSPNELLIRVRETLGR